MNHTVSIITITQYGRFESFKILFEMLKRQTYKNIIEWIIVEGSQNNHDATMNERDILRFLEEEESAFTAQLDIHYIEYTGNVLGELRNLGNKMASCDIIVCMDDDDYYPPTRVQHAVTVLCDPDTNFLIGGVSDMYIYDFFLNKIYKFCSDGAFGDYHSTNNCMAYKREYLLENEHDKLAKNAEERSFTKNYTNPLVQFDSLQTLICISHSSNTFNKRQLCIGGSVGLYPHVKEIEEPITNYIPQDIYNMMKKAYYKREEDGPYTIKQLYEMNHKTMNFMEKYLEKYPKIKQNVQKM